MYSFVQKIFDINFEFELKLTFAVFQTSSFKPVFYSEYIFFPQINEY